MTMSELTSLLDKSLNSTLSNKGELIASHSLKKGVDPVVATAIILQETGCKWSCSQMVRKCNNVGGVKGSPNCGGGYKRYSTLDEGIKQFIDNLANNYYAYGLDTPEKMQLKDGCEIGRVFYEMNAEWDYIRYVRKTVDADFTGIKVALDCANGSASGTAKKLFEGLGASCVMISDKPDGTNINENCGSTHIEQLMKTVVEKKCDVGLAFDGDADRCLAVDEKGQLIDGDKLLAIFSKFMKVQGKLKSNTCVVTVMSNLGFFKFAKENGINATTTAVGDRYVLERMQKLDYNLGGEQSGHIIFLDEANTGDGQLTGVKLLEVMKKTGKKSSELASCMETYPQVLVNVKITADKKGMWEKDEKIQQAMYKEKLGDDGRILVRESGTEPLVRVMLEGKKTGIITEYANNIAKLIEEM